jgi:deoxycytidylate deaminase
MGGRTTLFDKKKSEKMMEKTDRFISMADSNYEHPYDDPVFLALEDKIGYLMSFKMNWTRKGNVAYANPSKATIKSLRSYRKHITRDVCRNCIHIGQCYYEMGTIKVMDAEASADKRRLVKKEVEVDFAYHPCHECRVFFLKKEITTVVGKPKRRKLSRKERAERAQKLKELEERQLAEYQAAIGAKEKAKTVLTSNAFHPGA